MPIFQVLALLLSALVLTKGQGMPPDFNGRRIPYDLLVYFGNEQNATTVSTTVPTTVSTTGAEVSTPTTETPTNSNSSVGDSTTANSSQNAPLAADTTANTITQATTTQQQTTTTPATTTPVETTITTSSPTQSPTSLATNGTTGSPTTTPTENVTRDDSATSPSGPHSSTGPSESTEMPTESTTGSLDTTTSAQPAMTTGPVPTPNYEELRKNLTEKLRPIYANMTGYRDVQAIRVTGRNTRTRRSVSPALTCSYRLELDAETVTKCLANGTCNITRELIECKDKVSNLELGGYPVLRETTTAAFNTFLDQEKDRSLGSACQAGQPCMSYGSKYTCRINTGTVTCHNVCTEPNYCDGGTCSSNNVQNGVKMCRCPDRTVHNGSRCLNWWIVIGPSIGGAALLLIMIFVVIGLTVKLGRTDKKSGLKPSPSFTDSLRRYEMVGGQDNRAYTPDPTLKDEVTTQTFKYETPGTTPGASAAGPTEAATLPLADRGQPQDKAPANGVANGRSSLEMQEYPYQPPGAPPSKTYAQEVEEIMQTEAAKNFYPKLDHIDPKQDYSIKRPQINTGASYGDQVARF